jgi:hypothetical protein
MTGHGTIIRVDDEWLGPAAAAEIMQVSSRTVLRSLVEERRARTWNPEDWRIRPLSDPPAYQVRRSAARSVADGTYRVRG